MHYVMTMLLKKKSPSFELYSLKKLEKKNMYHSFPKNIKQHNCFQHDNKKICFLSIYLAY